MDRASRRKLCVMTMSIVSFYANVQRWSQCCSTTLMVTKYEDVYLFIVITMVLVLQWLDKYYFIVTVLRIVVFVSLLSSESSSVVVLSCYRWCNYLLERDYVIAKQAMNHAINPIVASAIARIFNVHIQLPSSSSLLAPRPCGGWARRGWPVWFPRC